MSEPAEIADPGPPAGGPPARIGRYDVVRELGRGTMGIVYEARDTTLGRTVALKTMAALVPGLGGTDEFEKRYFAEARIAARLSHPGLVVCHDVGKDLETGTLFIVLEYLKGRTVAQAMKDGGPMAWRDALPMVSQVARAMSYAHGEGVIHRDLKPANIMLLESGEPKVMDFGIAKADAARGLVTAPGQFFGSPLYMSPEQALGSPVDRRTDIFSLGTILCSLLQGRPHYRADNIPDVLARIIREDPPRPSALAEGVPPALDYVVARAMAKSLDDRYPDAGLLADDIDDVLASRPPRHAPGWAPSPGEGTMGGPARDWPPPEWTRAADPPGAGATATLLHPPPLARLGAARRRRIAALVLAGLAVALLVSRWAGLPGTSPEGNTAASNPMLAPPPPSPAGADAPHGVVPPGAGRSRLHLVIEHPLKTGTLRVKVDGVLACEKKLQAEVARKVVGIKFRESRVAETLEIEPGKHEISVSIAWNGDERVEHTFAHFDPAARRELRIKLGRIKKNLTLDWH